MVHPEGVIREEGEARDLQTRRIEALEQIAAGLESLKAEIKNTNRLVDSVAQSTAQRRSIERWTLLLGAALLLRLTLMPLMMRRHMMRGRQHSMMGGARQRSMMGGNRQRQTRSV